MKQSSSPHTCIQKKYIYFMPFQSISVCGLTCRPHHLCRRMSELLARSLAVKMAASSSQDQDDESLQERVRPLSVRNMSGPLGPKAWRGWAGFWTATLLENMGTILAGLIYPDIAVASMNDGVDVCAGELAHTQRCYEAVSQATAAASMFGLIGAICSFFCIPLVGTAADHFGRRPLLIFSFLCSKVPTLTLLFVVYANLSIYYYFSALMITAMVPSTMLFWFWINDGTTPEERVRMFGRLSALTNLEGIAIPLFVLIVRGKHSVILLACVRLSAVLTVICFVPESRPPAQLRSGLLASGRLAFLSRWQGITKLCSDKALRSFLPLAFIAAGTGAGINAIALFYCKAKFGLTREGFAPYVSAGTVSNAFVQLILIHPLYRMMGLRGLFAFSLVAGTVNCIVYALVPSPGWLLLLAGISGFANVGTPAIQALMSNLSENVPGMTPGVALGALQAVQSLIMILVPPVFQGLFAVAAKHHTSWLFLPFLVAAAFNLLCLGVLLCLPKSYFPHSE